ncbi:MAG: glycosyltransferase family 2 protein [Phycisphaerales bacterium]|nr:glycosyltransferase family 2 protein [Phycisphaerales bacterium]
MDLSVLIPTYQRPQKLAACLRALANQTIDPSRFEVLVGIDGPDAATESAAREAWGACRARLVVETCPRAGYNAVRNAMLAKGSGRFLVSLNDDVVPCPTFLHTHASEQFAAAARVGPAIISGYSPWRRWETPTLFDRLVAETSMIFFYDQMTEGNAARRDPWHDWGFRHCYGLNFSAPLDLVRQVGGFVAFPLAYGYDDIEISHRLRQHHNAPVLFRPEAIAEHDHRYAAPEVLSREFKLGHSAWHFAGRDPVFCEAVFRRDIRSEKELRYSREYLQRERFAAGMVREMYLKLDAMPAGAVGSSHSADIVRMLYLHHLPLKRWMWRAGLIAAAEGRAQDAIDLPVTAV